MNNNPQNTSVTQPTRIPWYIWLLGLAAVLIVVGAIFRVLTPLPTPPENAPNSWQGVVPGYSKLDSAVDTFGQPIGSRRVSAGTEYSFTSPIQVFPHQVVTDDQGTITFMKEYLSYKDERNLSEYTEKYGPADLVLKDEGSRDSLDAHVFLDEGLVILAHVADGAVEQIWYFEPTTAETFLASWGKNLTPEAQVRPEDFVPPGESANP